MDASTLSPNHFIAPQPTTIYTEGGLPADHMKPWEFPLEAVCMLCSRPIRRESEPDNWHHFSREKDVSA